MRIATSPSERCQEFNSIYRTSRAIGRPRKRCEDDINEFLKIVEEETRNLTESSNQINKTWINTARDRGRWALLEENYIMTSEEKHENNARTRRNSSQHTSEVCQRCEAERRRSSQHHRTQVRLHTDSNRETCFSSRVLLRISPASNESSARRNGMRYKTCFSKPFSGMSNTAVNQQYSPRPKRVTRLARQAGDRL